MDSKTLIEQITSLEKIKKELISVRTKYNLNTQISHYVGPEENDLYGSLKRHLAAKALKDSTDSKIKEIVIDINSVSELIKNARAIYSSTFPNYDFDPNSRFYNDVRTMIFILKEKLADSLITENALT